MSKYVNVTTGDYVVRVESGGNIVLDTGTGGAVRLTGDLYVDGTSTTVNSTDLIVEDNIIVLNKNGSDQNGILPNASGQQVSGIEIDRGPLVNARWLFDENLAALDEDGNEKFGVWSSRDTNNERIGIEAVSITTPGTNLYLLGRYFGGPNPGVISVKDTVDYHIRVTQDHHIPNKRYVDEKIEEILNQAYQDAISEGNFPGEETRVEVQDETVTGNPSRVVVSISGTPTVTIRESSTDFHDLRIEGSTIESTPTNQDLVFTANGTGRVVVDDNLQLTKTPHNNVSIVDPAAPTDGSVLYSKEQGPGETGIYFVNEQDRRGEIISKNRALLYGMLF